jgi:hypothetical protein
MSLKEQGSQFPIPGGGAVLENPDGIGTTTGNRTVHNLYDNNERPHNPGGDWQTVQVPGKPTGRI